MKNISPDELSPQETLALLTAGVAPRPIALVSTQSKSGQVNLAPFSFFNAVGCNPPMLVFSPARRSRDGSLKDTYENLMETRQCVVHAVSYEMAQAMNQSSKEYPADVNEFEKSGFTPIPSTRVDPPRVKESPVHMECELSQMIHLGRNPGSGNLAVCEIVEFHLDESKLDAKGRLIVEKMDHIGRNGGAFYTRALGDALFELEKP